MFSLQKRVDLNSISFISTYRLLLLVALLSGIYGNCVFDLSVDRETDSNCQFLGCFDRLCKMDIFLESDKQHGCSVL